MKKDYYIARRDDKLCFLTISSDRKTLIGDSTGLLQKFHAFCFNYQHVGCLYKLFKYQSSGKIFIENGRLFDSVQRAVFFSHQNREVVRMPSIAKMKLLRKKYKKHLLSSFQKITATQNGGSVFADKIEQVRKTEFELELIKIVDCFLDDHGNATKILINFEKKYF